MQEIIIVAIPVIIVSLAILIIIIGSIILNQLKKKKLGLKPKEIKNLLEK